MLSLTKGSVFLNSFFFNYQWLPWFVWCQRYFQIKNLHFIHLFFVNNWHKYSRKGFSWKLYENIFAGSAFSSKKTLVFSSEFVEIFESNGFTEHLLTTFSLLCCACGYTLVIIIETQTLNTFRLDFTCLSKNPYSRFFIS